MSTARASPIRLLPETLVNRIAAGEVIERPAAVVKELVENALDAGATRIAVTLTDGGIGRIEIEDDGAGMDAAGLALAVQRHCTSKLPEGDLVHIATLGFRGEALPSIGAVARLTLISRHRDADHASRIAVEGGVVGRVEPASGQPGTRVVVEDLFYATPARRKFLKAPRTEADHAEQACRRLAMAAPGVAMRLCVEGRTVFDLPSQDRAARVAALMGQDAGQAMQQVAAERDGMVLAGFACAPSFTRATGVAQSLVVNGRPVVDPALKTAIRIAYRDVIAYGRHPVVALWLDLPADLLDVNVHPAKTELRFRQADSVRGLVISGLQRALSGGAGPLAPRPALRLTPLAAQGWRGSGAAPRHEGFAEAQLPFAPGVSARVVQGADSDAEPARDAKRFPLGAPVAQVLDTYIIATAADASIVLVDQHAAHERLTHEALRDQMLAGGVRAQPLLLPQVVELAQADAHRLAEAAEALAGLGLEIEAFGPGAVLVRAMPAALGAADAQFLLRDVADELAESGQSTALEQRLDGVIARMACHGSIRAGRRLSLEEMDALLRRMEATPRAATCSHGRPTFLKLTRTEIERLFGR